MKEITLKLSEVEVVAIIEALRDTKSDYGKKLFEEEQWDAAKYIELYGNLEKSVSGQLKEQQRNYYEEY